MRLIPALPLQEAPARLEGLLMVPFSSGVKLNGLNFEMGDCFRRNFFGLEEGPRLEHYVSLVSPTPSRSKRTFEVVEGLGGDVAVESHLSTLMYFIENRGFRVALKTSSLCFVLRALNGKNCAVVLTWHKPHELSRARALEPGVKIQEIGLIAYEQSRTPRDRAHTHFLDRGALLVVPATHRQTSLFL